MLYFPLYPVTGLRLVGYYNDKQIKYASFTKTIAVILESTLTIYFHIILLIHPVIKLVVVVCRTMNNSFDRLLPNQA